MGLLQNRIGLLFGLLVCVIMFLECRLTAAQAPIPETMWHRMSLLSFEEFARNYTDMPSDSSLIEYMDREGLSAGDDDVEGCGPHLIMETLPRPDNPATMQKPMCVMVQRCGGCCGSKMHVCREEVVNSKIIEVMHADLPYPLAPSFVNHRRVSREVVSHVTCRCQCRTEASDCDNERHFYDRDSCSCKCRGNTTQCPNHKVWENHLCRCVCPQLRHCEESEHFNSDTCSCEQRPGVDENGAVPCQEDQEVQPPCEPCAGYICPARHYHVHMQGVCKCVTSNIWRYLQRRSRLAIPPA